ncbi:MAG: hypothetical protein GY913_05380 [Proteobacteria bacterium]|nr:hypothetical protein [Pseudomonadota bacterium]MCP4916334.1 hypothetical protein [Pseudomonadota bacterium]
MASLAGLILLACSTPEPGWRVALEAGLDEGLAACATDAECALGVLRDHQAVSVESCAALASGPFRDECHFLVAERLAEAGDDVGAAALCDETGTFRKSCLQHGFDRASERAMVLSPALPGADVEALLVSAASAYGGELADAERELWTAFWWAWWEREGPIDVSRCPDARCVEASRVAAMRRAFRAGCEGEHDAICIEGPCPGADEGRAIACDPSLPRPWTPRFR